MSPDHRLRRGAAVSLEELSGDAHEALARLRETEPVSWLPVLDAWLVTGYDAAVRVMRDADTFTVDDPRFTTARVVGRSMLSTDGPEHRRHRAPFVAPFRPAQVVERFFSSVSTLADDLVSEFEDSGEADLRRQLAGPLSVAVVAASLGLEDVDATTVLRWYAAIVDAVSELTAVSDVPVSATRAVDDLRAQLRTGTETGASLLDAARGALDEPELFANAAVMMFGGIETTEGMIGNALVHVLREPALVSRCRETPAMVGSVVEESLRMEPAAAAVDRYARRDVEVAGAAIASGDMVRVSLTGANRDPAVFADPDRFDPDRPDLRSQLSFARGPHVCVAMDLARLEARVALTTVLNRLPGLRLVGDDRPRGLVFRKPDAVRVEWDA